MSDGKLTVRVVAPGRRVERSTMERVNDMAAARFTDVSIQFHDQCFDAYNHFAGPDSTRAAALQEVMYDENTDIVWFARGGYGACRLLDCIDVSKVRARTVAGYSDGNFILSALMAGGFAGNILHCPMPNDILRPDGGEESVVAALRYLVDLQRGQLCTQQLRCKSTTEIQIVAPVFVSNLSILDRLLSTPYLPKLENFILVIEETSEYEFSIDGMLFHLFRSPIAKQLRALVLGQFTAIPKNDVEFGETVLQMALRWSKGAFPICWDAPVGHVVDNTPVLQGKQLILEAAPRDVG